MNTITFTDTASIIAMGIVLARCIAIVPRLSRHAWAGSRGNFLALSATVALLAGGAVGTALHWPTGPLLLLVSIAGWVLFDRRRPR